MKSKKFRFQNLIVFKVQNNLYLFQPFSSRFPAVFSMKTKKNRFHLNFSSFSNVSTKIFPFSSRFQYENCSIFVFTKILFQNLIVFKSFKPIFSVFQPFYEKPKRLEKQFSSCFTIQNA